MSNSNALLIPWAYSSERSSVVLSSKELIYDADLGLVFYGDGAALGGIPLVSGSAIAAISGSNGSLSGQTITFGDLNGLTFYTSNGSIVASYTVPAGGNPGISGSNGSFTYQTLTMGDLNGITHYTSNGSLVASYNSTQFEFKSHTSIFLTTQSGQAFSASNGSQTFQTLKFVESHGVTFQTSTDGIRASVKTDYQTSGNYLTTAMVSDAGSRFVNTSAGLNLTNISATLASDSISLSVAAPVTTNGLISNINLSAGTTSQNLSKVTFADSNGVSFGLNGSVITASVETNYLASDAGSDFVYSSAGLNLTNISATLGSDSISLSVAAQSVQPVAASASNGSFNFSTLKFVETNGVTFATSTDGIRASVQTNYLTSQSNQALSGSNGSFTFQTATLGNLNGLSFYTSNGSMVGSYTVPTQSNQTLGLYASSQTTGESSSSTFDARSISIRGMGNVSVGMSDNEFIISGAGGNGSINLSAGTTSNNATAFTFDDANGVSFGLDAGTITASHNGLTSQSNQALSGSNGSFAFQTATFGNANGMSFLTSNGSMVGSYTVPTVTNSSWTVSDAATSATVGRLAFTESNGLTLSLSTSNNGNHTVIGSYTVPDISGKAGTGFTSAGNNIGLSGTLNTAGLSLSATVAAQTNQTVGLYGLNQTTQNSSTTLDARSISLAGRGIITVGYSNGSVQLSATQSNQDISLFALNQTTQNSSTVLNASAMSIAGRGIVTVGYSNGSIQISATEVAQTNQSIGLYGVGNTTQNSSTTLDARTLSFRGNQDITVGYSNGSVQLSVNVTGAQSNQNISLFALNQTTQNSSTVLNASNLSIAGRGIITVGYSNGSIQISATEVAQTNQTVGLYALGNTTQNSSTTLDARTLSFNGLGIITAGYSNGSIQLSATQSAQSIGLYGVGNTTQNSSTTLDARTLSIAGRGNITVGYSNGTLQVSGSQSNQDISLYAAGNTTQNSSSVLNASTLMFNGAGNVSVGYSNGSIQISGGTAAASPVIISAGASSDSLASIVFADSNGVSFGLSGSTITASAAGGGGVNIAASNTTFTSGTVVMSNNGGALTISSGAQSVLFSVPQTSSISGTGQVSISVNASTISIGVPQPYISMWPAQPEPYLHTATLYSGSATASNGTNTTVSAYVFPMAIEQAISFNNLRVAASNSLTTTVGSSASFLQGISFGLYTLNGNNLSLASSWSNTLQYTQSTSNNGNNSSAGITMGWGNSSTTFQTGTSGNFSNLASRITGSRLWPLLWTSSAQSISPGQYFGVLMATHSTRVTNIGVLQSVGVVSKSMSLPPEAMKPTGSTTAGYPFLGVVSLVLSSNELVPNAIATANLTTATNSSSNFNYSAWVQMFTQ